MMILRWLSALIGFIPVLAFAQQPASQSIALQQHDAGTFYVNGAIEGYGDLTMLVDTGSSFMVIGETIVESLKKAGKAEFSRQLEGMLANGTRQVVPVYRIAGLRLGNSCWVHDIEAVVFAGDTRPILGMNVLARLSPLTFSAQPPQLGLNGCQAPVAGLAEATVSRADPELAPAAAAQK